MFFFFLWVQHCSISEHQKQKKVDVYTIETVKAAKTKNICPSNLWRSQTSKVWNPSSQFLDHRHPKKKVKNTWSFLDIFLEVNIQQLASKHRTLQDDIVSQRTLGSFVLMHQNHRRFRSGTVHLQSSCLCWFVTSQAMFSDLIQRINPPVFFVWCDKKMESKKPRKKMTDCQTVIKRFKTDLHECLNKMMSSKS